VTDTARIPAQLGALIRRERRRRNLSQAQLAERIGRRQATISKLENGEPGTQLRVLFDALAALNLDVAIVPRARSAKADIESIF
jgi:HTH-type transcriptional regulator/antitoxin HipB